MRKFYLITLGSGIIMAACLGACSADSDVQPISAVQESSSFRTIDDAVAIASKAATWINGATSSRAARKVDDGSVTCITSGKQFADHADTLLYVINYTNDGGFAVVGASLSLPELLVVTDSGRYDDGLREACPPCYDYLNSLQNSIVNADGLPTSPTTPAGIREEVTTSVYSQVSPRLQVSWGQRGCEGKYCPNGCAGCVNVALAMAMSYFEYPISIGVTFPDAPTSFTSLNWSEMKNHDGTTKDSINNCNDAASASAHESISLLLRELGYRHQSSYYSNGHTGTTLSNNRSLVSNLGFTISDTKDFSSSVYSDLGTGLAVVMGSMQSDGSEAHMWLMDGYKIMKVIRRMYSYTTTEDGRIIYTLESETTSYENYPHYNWGYNGVCNGYFLEGNMNLSKAYSYDNQINNRSYDFKYGNQYYVITK